MSSRLKAQILYIWGIELSGVSRRFWGIHKHLVRRFSITLLKPSTYKRKEEEKHGVKIKYVQIPYPSRVARYIALPKSILRNSASSNVIHEEMAPLPFFVPLYRRKKCVLTVHEIRGKLLFELFGVLGIAPYLAERMLTKIPYDIIISVSQSTYKKLRNLGIRSVLIYNGVDTAKFKPSTMDTNDKAIILTVGRLVKQKGHDYFLRIAKELLHENSNLHFVIIGDGPLYGTIRNKITQLDLVNNISLYKNLTDEEYIKALQNCSVYVHTNPYQEGFGFAVAEAMSCGKPVVAFDIPGLNEVVNNKCGILIPPGNTDLFVQSVQRLLEGSKLRRIMGRYGRKRIKEKFDWRKSAEKMRKVYDFLIEN